MFCVHYLHPPKSYAKKADNKKAVWKFTITNSQELTIQHFSTLNEYQQKFRENIVNKNKSYNIRTQVLLAAIGKEINTSNFFVFYDNISYRFDSILEAFEVAMQIHIVFDLKYQAQSQNFWHFIQYYFYDIPLFKGSTESSITKSVDEIKTFEA